MPAQPKPSFVQADADKIRSELQKRGMQIKYSEDFRALKTRIEARGERHGLLKQFDPDENLYDAEGAFWICGYDADGSLAFTQAVQLLDLRDQSLADYIRSEEDSYFPAAPKVKAGSVRTIPGPNASRITGMVVYHGEMWLKPEFRGVGNAHMVVRLGILSAVEAWDPDAIFGLMNWSLACDGFNNRIGYTHCEPMAVIWDREEDGLEHQVWTVYAEREDVEFMSSLQAVEFANILERKFK